MKPISKLQAPARICKARHSTGLYVIQDSDIGGYIKCGRTDKFIKLDFGIDCTKAFFFVMPGRGLNA